MQPDSPTSSEVVPRKNTGRRIVVACAVTVLGSMLIAGGMLYHRYQTRRQLLADLIVCDTAPGIEIELYFSDDALAFMTPTNIITRKVFIIVMTTEGGNPQQTISLVNQSNWVDQLDLRGPEIEDHVLQAIDPENQVQVLFLIDCQATGTGIADYCRNHSVKSIYLTNLETLWISEQEVATLQRDFPDVEFHFGTARSARNSADDSK